ncbi:MAG: hypothetical protein LIP08_14660 [Bacteroides sp.]|nr:hypothetical protein [Bacteroides sp.]
MFDQRTCAYKCNLGNRFLRNVEKETIRYFMLADSSLLKGQMIRTRQIVPGKI